MNISTETREILRNYRAVINARRREMGQKPLTTAQIVDEICDFVANQQAVFRAVTTSYRAAETGDTGAGGGGRLSARANPGRLAPAGRVTGHAGASPVTLPVCDVSGMFFLMLCFCGYCSSSSSSFRSSPVYGFPGRPRAGGLS